MINVRVTPEMRMRIDEVSEVAGVARGTFVRMCIDSVLSMMYDSEGYLMDPFKARHKSELNEFDGYFRAKSVSVAFDVSCATVYSAVRDGRVRSVKIGRSIYVRLSDVLRIKKGHGRENKH